MAKNLKSRVWNLQCVLRCGWECTDPHAYSRKQNIIVANWKKMVVWKSSEKLKDSKKCWIDFWKKKCFSVCASDDVTQWWNNLNETKQEKNLSFSREEKCWKSSPTMSSSHFLGCIGKTEISIGQKFIPIFFDHYHLYALK